LCGFHPSERIIMDECGKRHGNFFPPSRFFFVHCPHESLR
jgi:hypothetical protein